MIAIWSVVLVLALSGTLGGSRAAISSNTATTNQNVPHYPLLSDSAASSGDDSARSFGNTERGRRPQQPTSGGHRQPDAKDYVLERFDHRYPDGSYEFRYELADGTARYERGYFLLIDKVRTLTVVGYYSYRMPDGRYLTVFYNADQNGYRQNQSITPQTYPNLPRSIEVPREATATASASRDEYATTPYPRPTSTTTTRRGRF